MSFIFGAMWRLLLFLALAMVENGNSTMWGSMARSQGWSRTSMPLNATRHQIENWMSYTPCVRDPALVYDDIMAGCPRGEVCENTAEHVILSLVPSGNGSFCPHVSVEGRLH